MDIKRIIIISIILAIFAMGSACASADSSDDINATSEDAMLCAQDIECCPQTDEGVSGEILSIYNQTESVEISQPSNEETFNNLDYLISCSKDLALLDRDFTFNTTLDGDYVNGIGIHRDNLIIDGNNHIINGSSLARMFNVTGNNITFQNIVFVNGYSDNGGALHLTGSGVKIINCTFIDNKAAIDGGAVYIRAPDAIIADSRFINNTAIYNAAVYMNSLNAIVVNSYFENNFADISAGAIGWARKANGTVDSCTFIRNSAHAEGGGAIFWNRGLDGRIINSIFEDNFGEFNGSAIYWSFGDNGVLSNCSFINNNASVSGGALYIKGVNVTVDDCKFAGNHAEDGGAVYFVIGNNWALSNVSFINNTAQSGGAIVSNGTLSLDGVTFKDNTASDGNNDVLLKGNATMKYVVNLNVVSIADNIYGRTVSIVVNAICDIEVNDGNVSIMINNRSYPAQVRNGTATVEIPDLNAGNYNADMTYNGGMNFTNTAKTIDFTILKQNATIKAPDKSYVINYAGKYSVTLTDADGNAIVGRKVSFTFMGKSIGSSSTNAKGVATITLTAKTLKAAKVSKRKIIVNFGDADYNVASKTAKITVNKDKAKITAKKQSFKKSKKVKKFVAVLKNSKGKAIKGVKLTLKIKNKKFTAKTNKKGKATFKIMKLTKKGKKTAQITFKGDKYYKKATKKVKITIK